MKILQIRGRNLASLAGDFSLDFELGPLAEAGLFAIAGPTGAGRAAGALGAGGRPTAKW